MLDLNNLKEQLQTIFEAANTMTASPQDLSNGLTVRVAKILKVNPGYIPVQSDWYPFVTVYIDSKDIEMEDFAANQINAKRSAEVKVKIAGGVWNSNITDEASDDASDDCEDLMENVEQVLRSNPTVAGVVTWSYPTRVSYYNASLDEGVNLRVGVMDFLAKIYY